MLICVTGNTGQVGKNLCHRLASSGHDVIGLPRTPTSGELGPCFWNFSTGTGVLPTRPVDALVHLAAQTSAYYARHSPADSLQVNVLGFARLIEALRDSGHCPRVVVAGSATELDQDSGIIREGNARVHPTFYEIGKHAQAMIVKQASFEGWVTGMELMLTNVYGGVQSHSSDHRGFVNRCIAEAVEGSPLRFFGSGEQIRDYIHVTDVSSAFERACTMEVDSLYQEFVLGTGVPTTIKGVLTLISDEVEKQLGHEVIVQSGEFPSTAYDIEKRSAYADPTHFQSTSGWNPSVSLEVGVATTIQEYASTYGRPSA